ncbi:MAG: hypothetical protein RL653_988 [Pseudomonadota bacterium]
MGEFEETATSGWKRHGPVPPKETAATAPGAMLNVLPIRLGMTRSPITSTACSPTGRSCSSCNGTLTTGPPLASLSSAGTPTFRPIVTVVAVVVLTPVSPLSW